MSQGLLHKQENHFHTWILKWQNISCSFHQSKRQTLATLNQFLNLPQVSLFLSFVLLFILSLYLHFVLPFFSSNWADIYSVWILVMFWMNQLFQLQCYIAFVIDKSLESYLFSLISSFVYNNCLYWNNFLWGFGVLGFWGFTWTFPGNQGVAVK